jgi:ATP-dependent Clp protease protease subunit
VPGTGASAAAILLGAGTPGKRLGAAQQPDPHPPALHRGHVGQTSDIEIQANEILGMRELLEKMIARPQAARTSSWSRDIERDKILTAGRAVKYGLIDA